MERAIRVVGSVGPAKVVLVAFAVVLLVPFGARIGGATQGDGATPGASPAASPAATPSASPVAAAAAERGSLTVRILACDEATSVDGFDPAGCDPISGDTGIEIAGGGGDVLTVADSLRVSGGVFRWSRIPYGDYSVSLTPLPEGTGSVLAVAVPDGTPADATAAGAEITINVADPAPTLSLYLLGA